MHDSQGQHDSATNCRAHKLRQNRWTCGLSKAGISKQTPCKKAEKEERWQ